MLLRMNIALHSVGFTSTFRKGQIQPLENMKIDVTLSVCVEFATSDYEYESYLFVHKRKLYS